jgi:hypothetical protein
LSACPQEGRCGLVRPGSWRRGLEGIG